MIESDRLLLLDILNDMRRTALDASPEEVTERIAVEMEKMYRDARAIVLRGDTPSKTDYARPKPRVIEIMLDAAYAAARGADPDPAGQEAVKAALRAMLESYGGELGEGPKEKPLPAQKGLEKGGKSFGEELLDTGYDNGFGVTSLDTLLCEGMSRAERIDFAAFLIRTAISAIFAPDNALFRVKFAAAIFGVTGIQITEVQARAAITALRVSTDISSTSRSKDYTE